MRVTREEAIRSLRQKKAHEKKLAQQELEWAFTTCCSLLAVYALLAVIG